MNNILEKFNDKCEEFFRKAVIEREENEKTTSKSGATYTLSSVYPTKEIQEQAMKYLNEKEN